jgi:hypothetical protein
MRLDDRRVPHRKRGGLSSYAVTVEIKTGTRRILGYIFSPLMEVASTAMRER